MSVAGKNFELSAAHLLFFQAMNTKVKTPTTAKLAYFISIQSTEIAQKSLVVYFSENFALKIVNRRPHCKDNLQPKRETPRIGSGPEDLVYGKNQLVHNPQTTTDF